jgi:RNA-directed DNA polymerase
VALCHTREQAETVAARLEPWLKERGLALNQGKTRIGRIDAGFDFLSFTIRRYYPSGGPKVLTTPSRTALKKIRQRLAQELRSLRSASPAEVIATLNPIIRGQANYYRPGASTRAFQGLDYYLWRQLYQWARRRHPKKSRQWVATRYFRAFHPARRDQWVFGDRESGAWLHKYAWTKIVRHVPVPGRYSPDDPALAQYWADRRRKRKPPQLAPAWERALRAQRGCCPLCRRPLLHVDDPPDSSTQWETWFRGIRTGLAHRAITATSSERTIYRLVHTDCARCHPGAATHGPDQQLHDA